MRIVILIRLLIDYSAGVCIYEKKNFGFHKAKQDFSVGWEYTVEQTRKTLIGAGFCRRKGYLFG